MDGTNAMGMHDLWREFCVVETTKGDYKDRSWFYRADEMHESVEERRFCSGGWENLQRVCLTTSNFWEKKSIPLRVNLQHCSNLTVLKLVNVDVENRVVDVSPLLHLKSLEVLPNDMDAPVDIQGLGVLRELCILVWGGIPDNPISISEIASLIHLEVLVLSKVGSFIPLQALVLSEAKILARSMSKAQISKLPPLTDLCCLRLVTLRMGSLPKHLKWSSMTNLQYLDLSYNRWMEECSGLEDLVALVELDLGWCPNLRTLSSLRKLTKLESLRISGSSLSIVQGLDCLVALKKFIALGCPRLKRLPNMQVLSNLQVLDLRDCLVEPNLGLENMTSLQVLGVHFDTVKGYPSQPQLTKIQEMRIVSWGEQGLACMVGWTGLEQLYIRDCHGIWKLEALESLSSLRMLRIINCGFRDVSIVSCLTSLQGLVIEECKELEKVPSLDQLLKLEYLWLQALGLTIWEVCGTLPQLTSLFLEDLVVHSLPNLSNFPQLSRLKLSACRSLTSVTSDRPFAFLQF